MTAYDFDFFVVGAGSGGSRAARIAAGHGARVGVAEERYLGGTCVNVGCVPKKLFAYASHYAEDFKDAEGFGWAPLPAAAIRHEWPTLIANKNAEIARLNGIYRRLIEGAGARIYDKRAHLRDAHTIELRDPKQPHAPAETVTAERILVATGGWPTRPDIPGCELGITSNEAFFLEKFPERVLIVGGGYIAVEFAGIFHGLGAEVTQIYRGDLFMRGFDDDCRAFLAEEMRKKGIDLRFRADITGIERGPHGLHALLMDGHVVHCDTVLFATGRAPLTRDIGLEPLGVATNGVGAIVVDENWRTSVPHIYAIGDVTDRLNLTPVAIAEGHALADALFNPSGRKVGYDNVPTTVFSHPNLGTVGLTESQARQRYGEVEIYRSTFRPMKHTLSGRNEQSMMKLIVDKASRKVVGLHIVGPDAGEIVQGFAVAIKMGATKQDFDSTIGIHPTAAEELVTLRTPTTGAWQAPARKAAE
ncbi:MAG: glutathione-disulfide reductase [Rhodospirillaceae bacterium]|nr:glutathione-disulfide reductase [Rhodospirillaceae bacterium]